MTYTGVHPKNSNLKGRKRFNADLTDLQEACKAGLAIAGHTIKKVRPGDDEGSVEIDICHADGGHLLWLHLLVSDTSEYPGDHSLFGYSPDTGLSPNILSSVEDIASYGASSIGEILIKFVKSIARPVGPVKSSGPQTQHDTDEEDEEEDDDASEIDYDELDDFGLDPSLRVSSSLVDMKSLQSDFIQVVACGYRPGLIRFGDDDFSISISLPMVTLSESIPARALRAWDSRLLARSQHLTLLINGFRGYYPLLDTKGHLVPGAQRLGTELKFKVGLTSHYKPSKEVARDAGRTFGLITEDAEDELRKQAEAAAASALEYDFDDEPADGQAETTADPMTEGEDDDDRFDRFSLTSSLEALMDHSFLKVVQLRKQFSLGWAGAELLSILTEKEQASPKDIYDSQRQRLKEADQEEHQLSHTKKLPDDPFRTMPQEEINLPLIAFSYLVRRLTLCTLYCMVCHSRLQTNFEALKPYVCDSRLCIYQYYALNRGPSLEYEIIHNPRTVDLLVSLAHSAATEGVLEEPLPVGLALRVPPPPSIDPTKVPDIGQDGLCDFDKLDIGQMRTSITKLIDSLPAIEDMKKHLERKVKAGKAKPKLKDMDLTIIPAAWHILRWCVASCTAYIEDISGTEESLQGFDGNWRQFRFNVGAPDAEAKYSTAVQEAQAISPNAKTYPSLYAFHGSPLRNWHSIIRHGLWYKTVAHGRAFGHGVYLAKDAATSIGGYAQAGRSTWRKSKICPTHCLSVVEAVNLPSQFVSSQPHFVIKDTHWTMCRYLLVKGAGEEELPASSNTSKKPSIPLVPIDPMHPTTMNQKKIGIPDPSYQLQTLLANRHAEFVEEQNDEEDTVVFDSSHPTATQASGDTANDDIDMSMDVDGETAGDAQKPPDDWEHDEQWVTQATENILPPPIRADAGATAAVQRELKSMITEQKMAKSLKELGWYLPLDLIGDNIFQWIVEMHSFDETLPIARDLKAKGLNSIIFEIRFPPAFPNSPPFFRILQPRFLPFIHGGGGHVTGGGSICMDLLTADGWLPSYSIPAVLMQIKLAISNLDPRPARLAADWQRPYTAGEALEGFRRAAATHNWRVPDGLDKLVR